MRPKLTKTNTPNLFQAEDGSFWGRVKVSGRTSLRKLNAPAKRAAVHELRSWIATIKPTAKCIPKSKRETWQTATGIATSLVMRRPGIAPRTVAYYAQMEKIVANVLPEGTPAARLTAAACRSWWEDVAGRFSPVRANSILGLLRKVINRLVERGELAADPTAGFQRMRVSETRRTLPTSAQFHSILEAMGETPSRIMAEFMAYSGTRISEARTLTWDDVEFHEDGATITISTTKVRGGAQRFRRLPASPPLLDVLKRMVQQWPEGKRPRGPLFHIQTPRTALERAVRKTNSPHLRIHDLRHLFATRCIEAGVDIPTVSRWLGHSDGGALAMKTYGHLRDDHSRSQAARVTF